MEVRLASIGVLRAWEFCEGRWNAVSACAGINASTELDHVISRLLYSTQTRTTVTVTVTTLPTLPTTTKPTSEIGGAPTYKGSSQRMYNVLGIVALVGSACAVLVLLCCGWNGRRRISLRV